MSHLRITEVFGQWGDSWNIRLMIWQNKWRFYDSKVPYNNILSHCCLGNNTSFKVEKITLSKLESELNQQLDILIVINMHYIKRGFVSLWLFVTNTHKKRMRGEKTFFDIMPL